MLQMILTYNSISFKKDIKLLKKNILGIMNSKIKRVAEIVIIVLVAPLLSLLYLGTKTFLINEYIEDGGSFT